MIRTLSLIKPTKIVFLSMLFLLPVIVGAQDHKYDNYLQISPRIGIDYPTYNNNTPYIDYMGGMELGLSVDYYWKWIGAGIDFDFIKNKPESTYPTHNLLNTSSIFLTSFDLTEDNITRVFYGIGPDFKYQNKNERFTAELNTRIGLASISGGKTLLKETTTPAGDVLNYHAGYNTNNALSLKGQLRLSYYFNETKSLGFHIGAYYLNHFNVKESNENGISAEYWPFDIIVGEDASELSDEGSMVRNEPCNCGIESFGFFAGLSFRIPQKEKTESVNYSLAVTAKDKFTGVVLPNTDVLVRDYNGNVVQSGTTNSFGIVVFDDMHPDNYKIEGILNDIDFEGSITLKDDFISNKALQKEILYTDMNFILKGSVLVCNTTTQIPDVSVVLKNVTLAEQKSTLTDNAGQFVFHVKQQAEYMIYGKKDNYFSQTETISTKEYDRSTTIFVVLEICMEKADCDKSIALRNIHYDLDQDFIREDAKPDLERLAQFMYDNPDVNIELSSHTDSRASDSYNLDLSQRRANKAVDYLVSLGVDSSRLDAKGYGESMLLNECVDEVDCTEDKHQLNRRTEIKVICH
jgi:outer membrane protein OmpA-like peptidoglycan-associated protein